MSDLCPYCLAANPELPDGEVHTCVACGQLFAWSPKTHYEIEGRAAIRDLRRLREHRK